MQPLPFTTDTPLQCTPWANWGVIVATAIAFTLHRAVGGLEEQLLLNARDPALRQFVTYAFVHLSWLHLAGNVLALYLFGNNVNDRLGNVGYVLFYLAGAVLAAVAFVLTGGVLLAGASGAAGAVMGGFLVLQPRARLTTLSFLPIRVAELPAALVLVVYFLFNLGMSIAGPSAVAHVVHAGGMVAGFAICLGLRGAGLIERTQWDLIALVQRWSRRRQYRALVRDGYDPFRPDGAAAASAAAAPPTSARDADRAMRASELRDRVRRALAAGDHAGAAGWYLRLRTLDPANAALPLPAQLDVATQLAAEDRHADAADAYELLLRQYPRADECPRVQLLLGLLYARHLARPARAREVLAAALPLLRDERDRQLATDELARLRAGGQGG